MLSIEAYRDAFISHLEKEIVTKEPVNLYKPIHYILNLGGKRLRPVLTLMTADIFGTDYKKAMHAAMAVEMFHNFSLVHDDIMDDAPLRRGKETVHEKWDLNTGILSGDAMLIVAYQFFENYDAETLDLLLPYICALPQTGSNFINVNAIKKSQPEILVMLFGESLSLVSAANILSDRPISGFVDREEFLSHPELSNISLSNSAINSIKFNSDFYQLTVKVKNFEYPFVLNSYLQVLDSGRVRVVKRSQGVF